MLKPNNQDSLKNLYLNKNFPMNKEGQISQSDINKIAMEADRGQVV
jgi:hypothetical protein